MIILQWLMMVRWQRKNMKYKFRILNTHRHVILLAFVIAFNTQKRPFYGKSHETHTNAGRLTCHCHCLICRYTQISYGDWHSICLVWVRARVRVCVCVGFRLNCVWGSVFPFYIDLFIEPRCNLLCCWFSFWNLLFEHF